jgi:hypothetical protein
MEEISHSHESGDPKNNAWRLNGQELLRNARSLQPFFVPASVCHFNALRIHAGHFHLQR